MVGINISRGDWVECDQLRPYGVKTVDAHGVTDNDRRMILQ